MIGSKKSTVSKHNSTKLRLQHHFKKYDLLDSKLALISAHRSMDSYVQKIAQLLNLRTTPITNKKFACGESYVCLNESIRNKIVYLFVPFTYNVNSRVIETFFFIDALKAAEAKEINLIIPFLPYARQDRRNHKREHVGTRVFATCLDALNGSSTKLRLITIDLHSPQIESAYRDTHIEPLQMFSLYGSLIEGLIKKENDVAVIASPDFGGVKRIEKILATSALKDKSLGVAFAYKKRTAHNKSEVKTIVGDVKDKYVILIDDIIDTAGTLIDAARMFKDNGAKKVDIIVTHGLLNDPALERMRDAQKKKIVHQLIITDTVPLSESKKELISEYGIKIKIIPTTVLVADVIARMQRDESLSFVYGNTKYISELYKGIELKKFDGK